MDFSSTANFPNERGLGEGYMKADKTKRDQLKESNSLLSQTPFKTVTKRSDYFWKGFAVVCALFILISFVYLMSADKLDGLFSPNFNNTVNNQYAFNPTTTVPIDNQYDNKFDNSFSFNFDIDEELLKAYCNCS